MYYLSRGCSLLSLLKALLTQPCHAFHTNVEHKILSTFHTNVEYTRYSQHKHKHCKTRKFCPVPLLSDHCGSQLSEMFIFSHHLLVFVIVFWMVKSPYHSRVALLGCLLNIFSLFLLLSSRLLVGQCTGERQGQESHHLKHHMNCECCPVSLLIGR